MYSLTGGPGSGKTTQLGLLSQHGYATVSAGVLLRAKAPQHVLDQMMRGDLADHDYTNALIGQALDEFKASHGDDKIMLDGYPRALIQARWLLESYRANLTACLVLTTSDQCAVQRLVDRGRADDKTEAVEQRLEVYKQNVGGLLDYYRGRSVPVHQIDAERPGRGDFYKHQGDLAVLTGKPKTEAELEAMRESGRMLATVLDILVRQLEPGMQSRDLAALAAAELKTLGGEPAFLGCQIPFQRPALSRCHLYFGQRGGPA